MQLSIYVTFFFFLLFVCFYFIFGYSRKSKVITTVQIYISILFACTSYKVS